MERAAITFLDVGKPSCSYNPSADRRKQPRIIHEKELVNKNNQATEMGKQIAMLTEQVIQLRKFSAQSEEKIEILQHEK
jgi:hypothetical protein